MYGIIYTVKKTRPHNNERGYLLCLTTKEQTIQSKLSQLSSTI